MFHAWHEQVERNKLIIEQSEYLKRISAMKKWKASSDIFYFGCDHFVSENSKNVF